MIAQWEAKQPEAEAFNKIRAKLVNIFTNEAMFAKYPDLKIWGSDLQSWLEVDYMGEMFHIEFIHVLKHIYQSKMKSGVVTTSDEDLDAHRYHIESAVSECAPKKVELSASDRKRLSVEKIEKSLNEPKE